MSTSFESTIVVRMQHLDLETPGSREQAVLSLSASPVLQGCFEGAEKLHLLVAESVLKCKQPGLRAEIFLPVLS